MKRKQCRIVPFYCMVVVVLLLGCRGQDHKAILDLDEEVKALKTSDDRKQYLEMILKDDQKVRSSEDAALLLQYGKDSDEYMAYVRNQWTQDSINLARIEKYLETFGHPRRTELGQAADAPWMVIHHAQSLAVREKHFTTIYAAYLNGDINDNAISFYLRRMYWLKFRERFDMESPYRAEDEIEKLINALNLQEKEAKVIGQMQSKETDE